MLFLGNARELRMCVCVAWLLWKLKQWFVCMCIHYSSGMKRLPFSEDEFGSPPNKMARLEEPKKGTVCVRGLSLSLVIAVCLCGWVSVCMCMCVSVLCLVVDGTSLKAPTPTFFGPCDYSRSLTTHTRWRPPLIHTHTYTLTHRNTLGHAQRLTHSNKALHFALYPVHVHTTCFLVSISVTWWWDKVRRSKILPSGKSETARH